MVKVLRHLRLASHSKGLCQKLEFPTKKVDWFRTSFWDLNFSITDLTLLVTQFPVTNAEKNWFKTLLIFSFVTLIITVFRVFHSMIHYVLFVLCLFVTLKTKQRLEKSQIDLMFWERRDQLEYPEGSSLDQESFNLFSWCGGQIHPLQCVILEFLNAVCKWSLYLPFCIQSRP